MQVIEMGADFLTEEDIPTTKIPKETMAELRRRSGILSDLPPLYPESYRPCAVCGFDHEYEPEQAATVVHEEAAIREFAETSSEGSPPSVK